MSARVLVTGSSAGIGKAIARRFVQSGAKVMITGRDQARLADAARAIAPGGSVPVAQFRGDLTSPSVIRECVASAVAELGGIDVLVANVGSGRTPNDTVVPREEWERVFAINLFGTMDVIAASLPVLRRGTNPSIVIISSIAGAEVLGAPIAYGAAKSALDHAAKDLARRLGPEGIRVNVVQPGNILFPDGVWDTISAEDPARVASLMGRVPMRRFGTPEEVADAVFFLASAEFVTGAVLKVDGGQTVSV